MSYGPNFSDLLRGAADYVDKTLRGQNRAMARSINLSEFESPLGRNSARNPGNPRELSKG